MALMKRIRDSRTPILFLVVALMAASATLAEETVGFQVVVHSSNSTEAVTKAQLSRIFLKKTAGWPQGPRSQPVDQDSKSPVRASFTTAVHGKSVTSIELFWQRQIYSGRSFPPPELSSDQEVLEYVRDTPGAVGYVSSEARLKGDVKVLEITEGD